MSARTALRCTFAFFAALLLSASASAQLFRAYLAPGPAGNDANPCTLPAPCRLLPAALAAVADGGEIWMLDSANYNTATVDISKSVNILAVPGALGSVIATGGPAINIATAGVRVALRNLVITPLPGGGGTAGITMTNGASLTVENCVIYNLPDTGIFVSTPAKVRIADSTIRGNGSTGTIDGILITNGATGSLSNVKMSGNGRAGIAVGDGMGVTTTVAISDSDSSGNAFGFIAFTQSTGFSRITVTRSTASGNATVGVYASGLNASAAVGYSLISGNGTGLFNNQGTLESLGNNLVRQNTTSTSGAITAVPGV